MFVQYNRNSFVCTSFSATSVAPGGLVMASTVESLGDIVECEMASIIVLLKEVVSLVLYS